jgi:hypothetical protein
VNSSPPDWTKNLDLIDLPGLYSVFGRYRIFFEFLKKEAPKLSYHSSRPQLYHTPFGDMVIGSMGDDRYEDGALDRLCLLIEPGGNDFYSLKIAASAEKPLYLLLDLAGDDIYQNRNWGEQFTVCQGLASLRI